jgi:hypothetical protein
MEKTKAHNSRSHAIVGVVTNNHSELDLTRDAGIHPASEN